MSDLEKHIKETREFVESAQEIIAKLNDMVWTIDNLVSKQNGKQKDGGAAQMARHAAFQEEFNALLQRHMMIDPSGAAPSAPELGSHTAPDRAAAPRPGKYRQRV